MTFKTEKPYVDLVVTQDDMNLASVAFGWTLGFAYFVACHAVRETRRARRINTYVILIWSELIVCLIFAIICWLYLYKIIPHSFAFFMAILTSWGLQVQLLLQIIVNRLCILMPTTRHRNWLRWGTAFLIFLVNVSVYCIWIPAKLQISQRYHDINIWWDRCEKVIYLIVDGLLNWYFIYTVKSRLVAHGGLKKYQPLVTFNTRIIGVSLAMDVLIIAMMSLPNDFVYMQFHSVAYLVKLNIEMAMSNLIIKVARATGVTMMDEETGGKSTDPSSGIVTGNRHGIHTMEVQVDRQTYTVHDNIEMETPVSWPTNKSKSNQSTDSLTEDKVPPV